MLNKLSIIQNSDLAIDDLLKEKNKTPTELIEARANQEELENKLVEVKDNFDKLNEQINANQLEIGSLEQRFKEAEEAAHSSSTAKEVSQYQNQAHQFRTRIDELEEDTFPLMENQEVLEIEIKELKSQLDSLVPKVKELETLEEARIATLNEKVKVLSAERDALTKDINKNLLRQYDQIRRAKRGTGLVKVVDGQRCGGCSMRLPIHVVQKVIKNLGITRCPSCGRILWSPTVKEE